MSWRSKKQTCVALSTAEGEYVTLANSGQEVVWMRELTAILENHLQWSVVLEERYSVSCHYDKNNAIPWSVQTYLY